LRLHRDDDQVLGSVLTGIVAREADWRVELASAFGETPALKAQRRQRRAARQCRDREVRAEREMRSEKTADGAGADDADLQSPTLLRIVRARPQAICLSRRVPESAF